MTASASIIANIDSSADDYLIQSYSERIQSGEIRPDPDQQQVIAELQTVYNNIINKKEEPAPKKSGFFSFLNRSTEAEEKPIVKGLYLYGGVGRGKTHLVDFFFDRVPVEKKVRHHFHRFMQIVHDELALLDGVEDPLKEVAKKISSTAEVLCFDEFHVIDITDAMLLGKLLEHLFDDGLVLVTTSNFHPDDLYKDGLQRDRFIPAINLLKKHTKLVRMGGDYDYRSEAFKELGIYYFVNDQNAEERLEQHFLRLSGIEKYEGENEVIINTRKIPVKKQSQDIIWIEFDELCNTPRSTEDFTQIALHYHTVLISNISKMNSNSDDAGRRFINLIDTFYDMNVNVIASAEVEPEKIYSGKKLAFEFDRAVSRINEMQTTKYVETAHLTREKDETSA